MEDRLWNELSVGWHPALERLLADSRGNGTCVAQLTERPVPDEVELTDLSGRDYAQAIKRAARKALADNITDTAAALAYYGFLAIPSLLLVAVGLFGVTAGPDTVARIVDRLAGVVPGEAITLLQDSLTRITENKGGGVVLVAVGFVLALWTISGAMNAVMRALNRAWKREEKRGFVKQRLVALGMFGLALLAFALVFGLLVLGPHVSGWVGGAVGLEDLFGWLWWVAQWPVLVGGVLVALAGIYYLGPCVEHPSWRWITPGSVVAATVWLVASAGFALYVGMFGSYNKAWGSLGAVVVMLTWLWLSAVALLYGAELNAVLEQRNHSKKRSLTEEES